MKYYILVFIVFSKILFSQVLLNETFDYFPPKTDTGLALWVMDSTYLADIVGGGELETTDLINAYDLTATGFSAGFDDETETGSIISDGGNMLVFDGATTRMENTSDDFNPGTSDWTIQVWMKTPSTFSGNKFIINDRNSGGTTGYQLDVNGSSLRAIFLNGGAITASATLVASTIYYIWVEFDRSGNTSLVVNNGSPNTADISSRSAESVSSTEAIRIGSQSWQAGSLWNGHILAIKFTKAVLTQKQLVEDGYLARGWAVAGSDTPGLTRSSFAFHQGIVADTVYYATILTASNWSVTVNVDGAAGGESLEVLTSADASTWVTLGTISATTTATNYTVTGIGTGYIGFGLESGTVYIDNVTVSVASADAIYQPYNRSFKSAWKKWK